MKDNVLMSGNRVLIVLVAMLLAGIAAWIVFESGIFESANADLATLDQLFEAAKVLKMPHASQPVDFALADVNGEQVALSDLRGKIVVLSFWTTWCPPCRAEMPSMEKLYQEFKDKNFALVAVSLQETAEVVRRFFEDRRLNFLAVLDPDGEVGRRFRIRSIPTTYFLNGDGRIMGVAVGPREWNGRDMIALFEHLTAATMPAGSSGPVTRGVFGDGS